MSNNTSYFAQPYNSSRSHGFKGNGRSEGGNQRHNYENNARSNGNRSLSHRSYDQSSQQTEYSENEGYFYDGDYGSSASASNFRDSQKSRGSNDYGILKTSVSSRSSVRSRSPLQRNIPPYQSYKSSQQNEYSENEGYFYDEDYGSNSSSSKFRGSQKSRGSNEYGNLNTSASSRHSARSRSPLQRNIPHAEWSENSGNDFYAVDNVGTVAKPFKDTSGCTSNTEYTDHQSIEQNEPILYNTYFESEFNSNQSHNSSAEYGSNSYSNQQSVPKQFNISSPKPQQKLYSSFNKNSETQPWATGPTLNYGESHKQQNQPKLGYRRRKEIRKHMNKIKKTDHHLEVQGQQQISWQIYQQAAATFSGKNEESILNWLADIEYNFKAHFMGVKLKIIHVKSKLREKALTWYQALGRDSENWSWQEWKNQLTKAFPPMQELDIRLEEMLKRKMQPDETLDKYFDQKLAMLKSCDLHDVNAVSCLIGGLQSEAVKWKARQQNFTKTDLLYEYLAKVDLSEKGNVEEQKKKGNPWDLKTRSCYACQKMDHKFIDCSLDTEIGVDDGHNMPPPKREHIRCFVCQEPGHFGTRCIQMQMTRQSWLHSVPHGRLHLSTQLILRRQRTSKFFNVYTKFFTKVQINGGEQQDAYVDFDSELVMIPENEASRLKLPVVKVYDRFIEGPAGCQISVRGEVKLQLTVDEITIDDVTCCVVPTEQQSITFVIGQSLLNLPDIFVSTRDEETIKFRRGKEITVSNDIKSAESETETEAKAEDKMEVNEEDDGENDDENAVSGSEDGSVTEEDSEIVDIQEDELGALLQEAADPLELASAPPTADTTIIL